MQDVGVSVPRLNRNPAERNVTGRSFTTSGYTKNGAAAYGGLLGDYRKGENEQKFVRKADGWFSVWMGRREVPNKFKHIQLYLARIAVSVFGQDRKAPEFAYNTNHTLSDDLLGVSMLDVLEALWIVLMEFLTSSLIFLPRN